MPPLPARLAYWLRLGTSPRGAYVVINLAINLVFLLRSYVAMRVLDYADLGLVALLQTMVLLVGALQFGVVSGAYRLLCSDDEREGQRINNLVWSFFALVALGCALVCLPAAALAGQERIGAVIVLGTAAGVMTLLRNWINNQMLALVMLPPLNRLTGVSAAASIAVLALVPVAPLAACLTAVVVQPIVFVALALWQLPALRPTAFEFSRTMLGRVMATGFVVFLTGILLQINLQVERWYVVSALGLDALGHLYLSILFMGLFQIVPSSLDALFLPRLVRAHVEASAHAVSNDLRRFFLLVAGYCALAALLLWALAEPVLAWLLPKYVPDLRYVWLFLPGLLLFTLSSPFAIVFNVLIRYRTYLVAYGGGSLALAGVLVACALAGRVLGLEEVSLVRSAVYALMALVLVLGYLRVTRREPGLRFHLLRPWTGAQA